MRVDKIFWVLMIVFGLSIMLRFHMVLSQVPSGMMIDWGDNWSFLTVVELIKKLKHLPVQDLFFGGIPYVYPPLSLITYALLYMILPLPYTFISNNIAPIIGSLTIFGVYLLAHAITKDKWVAVLAAYLSLFTPRYLALSSIPIPEMFGHLQAPIFMYLTFITAKSEKRNHALLTGLAGATLFLNHHLTSAILFLTASIYFILLSIIKLKARYLQLLVVIIAVSFLFSSPWWFDTINKNIMNLVVREQEYSVPPFRDYAAMLSPFIFYVGVASLVYLAFVSVLRKDEGMLLIFTWSGFTLLATQSRHIVKILFEEQIKTRPNLLLVLAPIYGERYFNYMGQPWAIMNAIFLASIFYGFLSLVTKSATKEKKTKVAGISTIVGMLIVAYPTITYGFGISEPVFPFLDSTMRKTGLDLNLDAQNWALWRMIPDVNDSAEYEASLWMRENLPENANIVADYPSGEVISAGTLRKIVGGAELRVTVDVVGIYSDILVIYYTNDINEAIEIMHKRNATHVYISDRIIKRGWLPITRHSRWPKYGIGNGMVDTDEKKFIESPCFKRVYNKNKIRIYELTC